MGLLEIHLTVRELRSRVTQLEATVLRIDGFSRRLQSLEGLMDGIVGELATVTDAAADAAALVATLKEKQTNGKV